MHGSQRCCGELAELTVDAIWQIAGSATSNFRQWHAIVGDIPWSSVPKTAMDCHSKLVLHSPRNNQPVQVIVHQLRQTTLIFPGPSDQTCCSILNVLQALRRDIHWLFACRTCATRMLLMLQLIFSSYLADVVSQPLYYDASTVPASRY